MRTDPEQLEKKLEYVRAHLKEIHLFGERTDGRVEVCIIHGELKPVWSKLSPRKRRKKEGLDKYLP